MSKRKSKEPDPKQPALNRYGVTYSEPSKIKDEDKPKPNITPKQSYERPSKAAMQCVKFDFSNNAW